MDESRYDTNASGKRVTTWKRMAAGLELQVLERFVDAL